MDLKDKKIFILGFGVSGCAAAELAVAKGGIVTVFEGSTSEMLCQKADSLTYDCILDWQNPTLPDCDLIVISPGIPPESPLGQAAENSAAPVMSELEFGAAFCPWPVIAVTGTNGKTTTVDLLQYACGYAGYKVVAAGNIGRPISDVALKEKDLDLLILEVSSFQLEHAETFKPVAAAILNITPDHMDRHNNMLEYASVKARIFKGDNNIINYQLLQQFPELFVNMPLETFSAQVNVDVDWYVKENAFYHNDKFIMKKGELSLWGAHNYENILCALALLESSGFYNDKIIAGICKYKVQPHRLELAGCKNGVICINDSKSTNPDSLRVAIMAVCQEYQKELYLIAGGLDKGLEFLELKSIIQDNVRKAFLIGRASGKLLEQWHDSTECQTCESLNEAFELAMDSADEGDVILLSPGCASQDMFKDYKERGIKFCNLVRS